MDTIGLRRRALGSAIGLYLLMSTVVVFGQPMYGPPERITVEEAVKRIGGPTLVTLKMPDAEPTAIFKALAEQAGIAFDDYSARDHFSQLGKISVDFQARPIWEVLCELSSKLNLSYRPYDHPRFASRSGVLIRLVPENDPALGGRLCKRGAFLVIASRTARSVSLAKSSAGKQQIELEFVVLVDPKIRTRGEPEGADLEIRDDQGRSLTVQKPSYRWTRDVASHSPLIWRVTAVAQLPDVSVRKLDHVSGSLRFVTTTKSQPWEVNHVLQATNRTTRRDDAVFVLRQVVPHESGAPDYEVTLASWGRGEQADSGWPPRNLFDRVSSVRLLDARRNEFFPTRWEEQKDGDNGLTITFRQVASKANHRVEPATLVWDLPTEVSEIVVPFEFANIELP